MNGKSPQSGGVLRGLGYQVGVYGDDRIAGVIRE